MKKTKPSQKKDVNQFWDERAKLLKVMSHPVRLIILESLVKGPQCVKDINQLVDIPQPRLSQHMQELRAAGLIDFHINGPLRCYYILRPKLVKELIGLLKQNHVIEFQEQHVVQKEINKILNKQKGENKNGK